jgi:peptide/nickel transport system ATP-binding protein
VSATLLSAAGVLVAYPRNPRPAVRDVDLVVQAGAAIGIVGESGSGKTSLARALAGVVRPAEGQILVAGRPWAGLKRRDPRRRRVQMIFQDPLGSLNPHRTASQAVAEVFRFWDGLDRAQAIKAAELLLAEVGLGRDSFDVKPGRLSGGQCQRVGIARALACQPEVLIADEPTSALDVSVQAQILGLLGKLREERNLALVLVSHDLGVVRHSTSHVLVMYDGAVIEEGPTERVFDSPAHPYTKVLVESRPGSAPASAPLAGEQPAAGCSYAPRCRFSQQDCLAGPPPLVPNGLGRVACLHPVGSAPDGPKAQP